MSHRTTVIVAALVLLGSAGSEVRGQALPTTQPARLTIFIEDIKPGRWADHAANEAGWPAAFEKAGSPTHYLALGAMTGEPHVWFVVPYADHAAEAEDMRRNQENPVLSAELERLGRADAEYLAGQRTIQAMARPDLSHGSYPDLTKARYWDIITFRVRPGGMPQFEAAAKAYAAVAERAAPGQISFRVYQVTSGMAGQAFILFASVDNYAQFDAAFATDMKVGQAMTPEELAIFEAYSREAELSTTSIRYALDPKMSYVDGATKAADPAFWGNR